MKEYLISLSAWVDLTDVERLINWADQGWKRADNNDMHSLMVRITKEINVKIEESRILSYIAAVSTLGGDICVEWWQEIEFEEVNNQ